MRAAILYGKEDVRIEQVAVPRLEAGDVLLRTRVALTCGTDAKVFRRGYHAKTIVPPAMFGHEIAGVVEEVGSGVEGWEPGLRMLVANLPRWMSVMASVMGTSSSITSAFFLPSSDCATET